MLKVAQQSVGCIVEFHPLNDKHAAILSCTIFDEPHPVGEELNYVCIDHWRILNLKTGDSYRFEAPQFDEYFSSPAFSGELVAYWGLHREYENDPLTGHAMVFHWPSRTLLRHSWAGVAGRATDSRHYLAPPKWSTTDRGMSVRFDLSALDFTFRGKELVITLPERLVESLLEIERERKD
jgi:hypothetical protein